MTEYTDRELMVIAAGREIRDGELVFVGMRLPLLAFAFAKRTQAPGAIGLFENGIVRDQPARETLLTMSDTPNIPGALWSTGTLEIMSLLQQGLVDLGFLGGAEVDKYGNLNTNYIGDWRKPKLRLPGSGGGAGARWRERVGLPGGGPSAVITTLGVYRFDPESREMLLASWHPGQSIESVRAATGWSLRLADGSGETPTPTAAEL